MDYPRIRQIEPFPAEGDNFYLRDPQRISDAVLLVPRAVLYVISLFDGKHSLIDVQSAFARATGEILTREKIDEILAVLDEALFLVNERSAAAQADIVTRFHDSDVRPAINAGLSYPGESEELRSYLSSLLESVEAEPTAADRGAESDLAAIVAPHIDLRRGGGCYAAIYRELARRSKARRFIVLGICHHPTVHRFALCRKDYDTPLGLVKTDRELVDRLAREVGTDFLADEIAHREEHSVEFQLLFLQYLFGGHSSLCGRRDFSVVPILCSSFHDYVAAGEEPAGSGEVAELLTALGRLIDRDSGDCLVAAVDFAHLGRQFGQDLEVNDELLRKAEADDRRMVERISSRDAAGFFRLISEEKDARNVCGVPAIYSLLRLLGPGAPARLLRYGQAADRENHSVVTFAGIEFPRQG